MRKLIESPEFPKFDFTLNKMFLAIKDIASNQPNDAKAVIIKTDFILECTCISLILLIVEKTI